MGFFRGLFAALALAAPLRAAQPITVHVYHTNDVHGWIMARPDSNGRPRGGAPALAALLAKDPKPRLLLDAGDWWQGTPEGSLTKGEAVAETFNALGYDAVAVGNHDFDAGQDSLKALIGKFKMPVLAANIYGPDGKRVPWAKPWIVKEVAGIKFGIFGLLTARMRALTFPKHVAGLTFRRESEAARAAVKALRREGADVIVAVTHVGFEEEDKPPFAGDQDLARRVEGIDLIVGGHSHTVLSRPWRDLVHGTLIAQAGSYLTRAGRIALAIDPVSKRVISADGELIDLRPDQVGEDSAVKAIVERRAAEAGRLFDQVVATAAAELSRRREGESPLGSWMADCYRDWSGADVALQNAGGIRADIPAGPVTLRTLFYVMPFDNELVGLRLTGAQLRAVLAHAVGAPRTGQLSGVEVRRRRDGLIGERLVSAAVGDRPLDDGKTYVLETLDFLVSGGDGYDFGDAVPAPSGVLARDVLRACAAKQGTISPPRPGRLKATED
ncbi:MAG: bifunctional metallophosphatase/5'-nucleotidase [Elusimicrobia bacterium]|nr:bifunctional metallophosphatase/5'-nucleotidase [Elusimicrobiota bacterium]